MLLREAVDGAAAARELLVGRVDPLIRAHIRVCMTNGHPIDVHEVDDIAQQIWIRLFDRDSHRLRRFDPSRGSLEAYIGLIARQGIAEIKRRVRPTLAEVPVHQIEDPGPSPERLAESREQARSLRAYLASKLPVRGQLVLKLLFDDGRSEDEVAEIMGISKQVVANWKHKIRVHAGTFRENST